MAAIPKLTRSPRHLGEAGGAQGQARSGPPAGLVCHNFRGTDFQAVILRHQLEQLPQRIDRYNRHADHITQMLAGIDGVRVQARGRRIIIV
ncbi:MAG: hypothetical protein HC828_14300 [Blastochloris sp.]|nr:hypothetical protein [Blastochloris sp.]